MAVQFGDVMTQALSINSLSYYNLEDCCFLQTGPIHLYYVTSHYKILTLSCLYTAVVVLVDNSFAGSDIIDPKHSRYPHNVVFINMINRPNSFVFGLLFGVFAPFFTFILLVWYTSWSWFCLKVLHVSNTVKCTSFTNFVWSTNESLKHKVQFKRPAHAHIWISWN